MYFQYGEAETGYLSRKMCIRDRGWMLHYFYMTAAGKLSGLDAGQVADAFTEMLASPLIMGFWMVVVVVFGIFVCARGLQNGLEKVTKGMMIALLVIMVCLLYTSGLRRSVPAGPPPCPRKG